jgi:flavin reductase (DIM6/NTAB) family NADH-FMN oxidoreductase RutF
VTVITTKGQDGQPLGVTISSFTSLSLEPPLVLFCLGHASGQLTDYVNSERFAVNLLSARQLELSELFASQQEDKFDHVEWTTTADGYVVLNGGLAALKCETTARHVAGDHTIVIGEVEGIEGLTSETHPLLRYRGAYHGIGPVVDG